MFQGFRSGSISAADFSIFVDKKFGKVGEALGWELFLHVHPEWVSGCDWGFFEEYNSKAEFVLGPGDELCVGFLLVSGTCLADGNV